MSFSRIIGYDRNISLLRRALATGKLSHAYLFYGIDGSGMMDTAVALIEAIFCNGTDGCGDCPTCRKVAGLRHPDLHHVRPDGAFIKIDQIRELQKELSYRPFEAPKKACIIEDAEKMNISAANAFLKTLEEPSGNAILILITTRVDAVLPTVLSRCQQLRFPSLPTETIASQLRGKGADEDSARIAAALAEGSVERAQEILEGDWLKSRTLLLEKIAGLTPEGIIPLLAAAEESAKDKESALHLMDLLNVFWRDVLLTHTGSPAIVNTDLSSLIRSVSERNSLESVLEKLERIFRTRQALTRNTNPRLAVEVLFMGLADQ
ncbi:MAG: DNA polymerase III subunit delta' [Geobacter sp.]|nr:MAG: DNA polymerase III subunit delta' [Geobacter sp.]